MLSMLSMLLCVGYSRTYNLKGQLVFTSSWSTFISRSEKENKKEKKRYKTSGMERSSKERWEGVDGLMKCRCCCCYCYCFARSWGSYCRFPPGPPRAAKNNNWCRWDDVPCVCENTSCKSTDRTYDSDAVRCVVVRCISLCCHFVLTLFINITELHHQKKK